ncbi:hypothetical protein CCR75_002900 [Bremia lactucae]|uniref:C2H2-type domain-containing protein n=1 Tax=Bremia lactucae TaxID=4779 RepID=A0A976IFU3_BRELC|nr:hypothetical protein CCR75_002900 [Bremia lactucae]
MTIEVLRSHPENVSALGKRRRLQESTNQRVEAPEACNQSVVSADEAVSSDDTDYESSKDRTSLRRSLQCAECREHFHFAAELVTHSQQTHHRPFRCQYKDCDKCYSKREHLTRHVDAVHIRGVHQSLEERKPFNCELCKARFTYNHGLTRHLKRSHHNVNRPFECSACLKGFKKKSELQAHSYVHTGVLPFQCNDCSERFLKKFWLTRHQRKHQATQKADTQVYACACGEIYFEENELQSHKESEHHSDTAIESNEINAFMQHSCLVCEQTFTRKQYLRAHLRTHFESLDDRKHYVCSIHGCHKSYTRQSNLMTHYNAVHDKRKSKRFACPREGCTARFGYKTVLKHHLEKIHDHPKPPKRRNRKSAGILERALGLNQVGDALNRSVASKHDEARPLSPS